MKKIDLIWVLFKIYLNDPNYYVRQEDVLVKVLMKGQEDLEKILIKLDIPIKNRKHLEKMTFGKLLKLCNI